MKQSTNAVSQSAKSKGQNSRKDITSKDLLKYIQRVNNNTIEYFSNELIEEYDKHLTESQHKTCIEIYNYIKDLEESMDRLRSKQLDEIQATTSDEKYVIHIRYLSGKDYVETLYDNIKALNRFKHLLDSSDQIDVATLETPYATLDPEDLVPYVEKEA